MTKCPMLTIDVINAIDEEIAYQNSLQEKERADNVDHGVAGQLLALKHYNNEAFSNWISNPGDEAALNSLRKCAAICCRALILYGCPKRYAG